MMKKKIISFIAVLILFFGLYGVYLYTKPPTDVASSDSEMSVSAEKLIGEFEVDPTQASQDLQNKIIEISGEITEIEHGENSTIIILDQGVKCELHQRSQNVSIGQQVHIKGLLTGYDEMFNEISLLKCHILNP